MWRVVCVGPGPMDRVRRIEDRGPLHPDLRRAESFAGYLRSTGLYESVKVVRSAGRIARTDTQSPPADGTGDRSGHPGD